MAFQADRTSFCGYCLASFLIVLESKKIFLYEIGNNIMLSRFRQKINENMPLSFLKLQYGPHVFECPICGYRGLFAEKESASGKRKHALCPRCYASERHRLQSLVLNQIIEEMDVHKSKVLHLLNFIQPDLLFE